jgi:dipeptidyl aminopeptidase/acylaminoacyl peptidase
LPPGKPAKNLPLVVMPHGGPVARDYVGFDWWAQAFASRGYAVFQPNFRGSNGFGKGFIEAGYGQWGRKMQTDISDGVADLAKQGLIDPKRACIVGASYGGYAALAGVTLQQGLYRCAVSVGGVSNLNDLLKWDDVRFGDQSETLRIERERLGATSIGDPAMATISPARHADMADAPILLMFGHDDTVVNPQQSRGMADALKSAGKPVELVELPEEDHWLSRPATRIAVVKASLEFVMKNNPPD